MDHSFLSYFAACVAFLAFVGNVLITLVGLKLPAHPKNLTQVFLISLSVADILLTVQVPLYILGLNQYFPDPQQSLHTNEKKTSITADVLCSISSFLLWATIKVNIFMVMVMGIDRMAATCYAATYLSVVKRQYAITACTVVWTLSFCLAGLPGIIAVFMGNSNPYSYDDRFKTCTPIPDFCSSGPDSKKSHFLVYFLIELVVTFFLPLICIVICYILICTKIFNLKKIRTISRHFSKKQIFKSSKSKTKAEKSKQIRTPIPEEGSSRESQKAFRKESEGFFATRSTEDPIQAGIQSEESALSDTAIQTVKYDNKPTFKVNANPAAERQTGFRVNTNPAESRQTGFRVNTNPAESGQTGFRVNTNPAESRQTGFRVNTNPSESGQTGFKVNTNPAESRQTGFRVNANPAESGQTGFRVNANAAESGQTGFRVNANPVESVQTGFRVNTNPAVELCNHSNTSSVAGTSKSLGLYPSNELIAEECCEPEALPNMVKLRHDPPKFSIDPTMQRRRFNFFTTNQDDDEFGECPEPGAAKTGILASSINVIEKHYSAIEAARDELAKKMRVYKYQIRVARTAIVVCTFFFVCYVIYEIGILYVMWGVDCKVRYTSRVQMFLRTCHLFLFINSALNVLIYGMMHRTVRAQLSKIVVFCQKKKRNSDA